MYVFPIGPNPTDSRRPLVEGKHRVITLSKVPIFVLGVSLRLVASISRSYKGAFPILQATSEVMPGRFYIQVGYLATPTRKPVEGMKTEA